ncbi:MAG: hypothetical protein MZV49_08600 [Rhodopseudomonas palustris]|nr:hypothetical protein [Rhodopseudomonas palustris]
MQTNPGTKPGPMMKVASGGELSRFLLALKVVLSDTGSAPTLVFDEIDTGVGGAVADAIGASVWRGSASKVQVMAVTHAPQVAARADQHLRDRQGRARPRQAGRDPGRSARRRPSPRGDRAHAGRRRDHRRSPRRRRPPDQGGGQAVPSPRLRGGRGEGVPARRHATNAVPCPHPTGFARLCRSTFPRSGRGDHRISH